MRLIEGRSARRQRPACGCPADALQVCGKRQGKRQRMAQGKKTLVVVTRRLRRIGEILGAEAPGTMLRVSVEGGGCSGFQYRFDMEQSQGPDDLVIAREGAKILIDPISLRYLEGAEIDFVDDLIGASFKIANPNATASCGCGTSFSV